MTNDLPQNVQMQFMRPGQLEKAARAFPVVYVPFGLIEWHGRHLPLGNDAIKAHAFLVKTAQKFGGVVYPPVFFHAGFDQQHLVPVIGQLFAQLKATGFRVIIGVSGHNIPEQLAMIENALADVTADGQCTGAALWEMTLSKCAESDSDHAAKWETSNMMFFYPQLVDLSELGDGEITFDMSPPHGISGLDPRRHASAAVGQRNAELACDAMGRKARELLASLPEDRRRFNLPALVPGQWWMI
ncbi:MAG: creatininase family protein [Planctomycetaceae bacterium]|nr:creatininase family protein [Planctomycetaceae bacterium]